VQARNHAQPEDGERGRQLLIELAQTADVLLENFLPTVMPRLGLGPEVLLEANPRLIYASGSGFGRTGPYAETLALDLTIQAMSGLMSATGEIGGRPLRAGVPVADFMAGAHLYGAIVAALYERESTGRGRVVEVSMLESVFATLAPNAVPPRSGNRHVANSYVPFGAFETADGWVTIVCATDEHWSNLTKAMDRPDLGADSTLGTVQSRTEAIERVTEEVTGWTSGRTREEITAACRTHHVPAAPLHDILEVLADPHLHERGFLTEHETRSGRVSLPNSPVRYEGSSLRPLTPAPDLGQHTDEILSRWCGLEDEDLAALRADGVIGG
jgi:CoA:oxalate CoA-transferase